jgi:hypothetical protein
VLRAWQTSFFQLRMFQLNQGCPNRATIIALSVFFGGASSLLAASQVVAVNDFVFEKLWL